MKIALRFREEFNLADQVEAWSEPLSAPIREELKTAHHYFLRKPARACLYYHSRWAGPSDRGA